MYADHAWDICEMCGPMVVCGYCGNNCCNGGTGDNCPDKCASAYAMQDRGAPQELTDEFRALWRKDASKD